MIFLKHRRNSTNSSMPPSSDIGREPRNNSLRKFSGKKPGGQTGHKGTILKMIAISDLTEIHNLH